MESNKKRLIIALTIFIITTLLLSGYIIYNKVLSRGETAKPNEDQTDVEEIEGITEDEDFFNELLYIFLPMNSAGNFMRNIETFEDEDITNYVFWNYENYASKNNLGKYDETGVKLTYEISKKDIDELVFKVFGKKEYNIIETEGRTGVKKINDNTYQIYWFASGFSAPTHRFSEITNLGNEIIISYYITANEQNYTEDYAKKDIGTLKFHLVKNNENYNVTKIEYTENE